MLNSHVVNQTNCCLSYSERRNAHGKVGNVCKPCFSILCQRCELFLRGRAHTHSPRTCRSFVASEGLTPPSLIRTASAQGLRLRLGARAGARPPATRGRENAPSSHVPPRAHSGGGGSRLLQPPLPQWPRKKHEPAPPSLPSPVLLLSLKRWVRAGVRGRDSMRTAPRRSTGGTGAGGGGPRAATVRRRPAQVRVSPATRAGAPRVARNHVREGARPLPWRRGPFRGRAGRQPRRGEGGRSEAPAAGPPASPRFGTHPPACGAELRGSLIQ